MQMHCTSRAKHYMQTLELSLELSLELLQVRQSAGHTSGQRSASSSRAHHKRLSLDQRSGKLQSDQTLVPVVWAYLFLHNVRQLKYNRECRHLMQVGDGLQRVWAIKAA
jgi:hypothetical protein